MQKAGGLGGARTHDKWLKRPLLYRLSYQPNYSFIFHRKNGGATGIRTLDPLLAKQVL